MSVTLLETWSNKKLISFLLFLLFIQISLFLIGGLYAPNPNSVIELISNICNAKGSKPNQWFARQENCENLHDNNFNKYYNNLKSKGIESGEDLVFSFKMPLPREGTNLHMSPWFQNMVAVMSLKLIVGKDQVNQSDHNFESLIKMNVRLGYKNEESLPWKELHSEKLLTRPLFCSLNSLNQERYYEVICDNLLLFELGSVSYKNYLLNIKIPSNDNNFWIHEINIYLIHQTGGFTFIWFTVKSLMFPLSASAFLWYIWKLFSLSKIPNILERTLIAVGIAITLLNFPIDWLTLWLDMPFMLLYSDIRQGIFYSVLLCFWVIFAGEHMMGQTKRNSLKYYWKELTAVACSCICLFLFDFCERGFKLANPFFSVWYSKIGNNLANFFLALAGVAALVYLIYLIVSVVFVLRNICAKRSILLSMSKPRQKYYKSLIHRFSFLMVLTLVCAFMTFLMYFIGQWEAEVVDTSIHYTSAVQVGVYGMWNLYVLCLFVLYSPSSKSIPVNTMTPDTQVLTERSSTNLETPSFSKILQKSTHD